MCRRSTTGRERPVVGPGRGPTAILPEAVIMPFARIDLIAGKSPEYRAAVADIVDQGIVDILEAPGGDCFVVIGEHKADNIVYDPQCVGFGRSSKSISIQVTSTAGNKNETKFAF